MKRPYAEVHLDLPMDGGFTYAVPDELENEARPGRRALVPFGSRTLTGFITTINTEAPPGVKGIKPVIDVLDTAPLFDAERLKFFKWLSSYYFASLGQALSLICPAGAGIRSQRKISLTDKGKEELSRRSPLEQGVLEASRRAAAVSALVKRFRGSPVYSAIERLKRDGLVAEETLLRGGTREKTEECAELIAPAGFDPSTLRRSPIQLKAFNYLLERKTARLDEMRSNIGNVREAVKRLEEKGLLRLFERRVLRDPLSEIAPRDIPFEPNVEQRAAIDAVAQAIRKGEYSAHLLYGVTGSGKTLVYLNILEEALKTGKKALYLAPEIALTPWPAAYLAAKFPGRVALMHSGLTEGERADEWERILKGGVDVVVGARSALFSPLSGLGLIIVDEEHESSYKQDDGVRYNARDAALMLGKHLNAAVVLGSATPSIESFYNAKNGKLNPLVIKKRVLERPLPQVEIMDMRGKKNEIISDRLSSLLQKTVADNNQALLFLNRRGFSSSVICRDCGHAFMCLNCSVTLTMHKRIKGLKCHYCDNTEPLPDACPECKGTNLTDPGAGTEKVEEEVRRLLPKARVARLDRDTASKKGSARRIIDAMEKEEVDVLIGTQMVSKGHHFPGITLVGVVSGDTALSIPDFRSSERTFQMITQAAGRAGRGSTPGEVVIQTLNPDHYSFLTALKHDYDAFYAEEMMMRRDANYPPLVRLCNLRVEGHKEDKVIEAAMHLKAVAEGLLLRKSPGVSVLGPSPAPIALLKGRYRWQMLVKGASVQGLNAFVKALQKGFDGKRPYSASLIVDMDPVSMM